MNHTLYPEILLPVTALVLAGATCMGYINFNENLLQLQLQLQLQLPMDFGYIVPKLLISRFCSIFRV